MVAAVFGRGQLALAVNGAAEFAAPDHQRVVQHARAASDPSPARRTADRSRHLQRQIPRQVAVLVPAAMIELDEAHAALGQPPRQQAIGGEGAGLAGVRAVQFEGAVRLLGQIGQLRHGGLHAVSHLILRDAGGDLGIAEVFQLALVQLRQRRPAYRAASCDRCPAGFDRYSTGSPLERNLTP